MLVNPASYLTTLRIGLWKNMIQPLELSSDLNSSNIRKKLTKFRYGTQYKI